MTATTVTLGVPTTCRSCSAPIEWAQTAKSGKLIPLDLQPTADGNLVIDDQGVARVVATGDLFLDGKPRRKSHFATCPRRGEVAQGEEVMVVPSAVFATAYDALLRRARWYLRHGCPKAMPEDLVLAIKWFAVQSSEDYFDALRRANR